MDAQAVTNSKLNRDAYRAGMGTAPTAPAVSRWDFCRWRMIVLAILALCCAPFPLAAQGGPPVPTGFGAQPVCYAAASARESYRDIARLASRWSCDSGADMKPAERYFIRYGLDDASAGGFAPRYLAFIRAPFGQLEAQFLGGTSPSASSLYAYGDIFVGPESHLGFVPLPAASGTPTALLVTLDEARYPAGFVAGSLTQVPPVKINAGLVHLLAALICGLLLAPVLFDLGFYRTLRESFPLYHAFFCLTAVVQTASISGLIPLVFGVSGETEQIIAFLSFDLMLIATILFVGSFVEDHILTRRHRRVLALAACMPVVTAGLMFAPQSMPGEAVAPLIYICLGILLVSLFYVMGAAWRRGSKAIRYITLAFAPLLTIGVLRISGALVPALYIEFSEMWAQSLALVFEVSVTSFAVASRFLTIKHERDNALDAARSLETISEHDALTGLLNRRALEARFDLLRAEGFTAMAVLDLDHFKAINDTYGHQLGDEVLVCAALALRGTEDPDLLAFRIGGEEFLILLRGRAKRTRAEAQRQAISSAVASKLAIDRKVTASMGYIEASAGAIASASFEALYERADRLLYEAKERGRDMMVAERVKVFERRKTAGRDDRRAA